MAAAAEGSSDLPSLGDRSNRQPAKVLTLYRNGDNFFPGKKFTWNMHQIRTFDTLLEHFSSSLNLRGGAVRRLYTPEHGHRVKNLDILEEGKAYVAAPQERFKKIDYANIDQIRKRRSKRTQVSYDVPPVVHARHQVSGRIKRVNTMGKVIKCWANGEDVNEPHTVHIPPSLVQEQTWDRIFDLMTIAVRDLTGPPVRVYTRQGQEVVNPQDLDHMGYYVIAPKFNARFKDVEYKEVRRANFHTSPVPERRVLPPVRSKNTSKSNSLQSSPDHSWASHPGSENGYSQRHRRNLARQRQEEAQSQGFYAKPTAHKRSGEAKGKPVDLDQDKGGVFKAKNQNKATRGAQEVRETKDTRTEVPVDQRKAEVVSEELKTSKKGKDDPPKPANGPRNARQSDARTTKPQNEAPPAKAKTNSYRGPPPTNSQPPPNSQPASNGIKQNSPPATSTPKNEPKNKQPVKKAKSPSPPPPAKQEMSEDEAATRIQAQFRGHQTRKEMEGKPQQPPAAASPRREDKRRSPSPGPQDDMSEEEAATKIQASFRGYQARRDVEQVKAGSRQQRSPSPAAKTKQRSPSPAAKTKTKQRSPSPAAKTKQRSPSPAGKTEAEKEEEAATKIQAVYRGHATRRQLADDQSQQPGGPPPSLTPVPGPQDQEDQRAREEAAATKIQATYRGHATRRDLQQRGQQQSY